MNNYNLGQTVIFRAVFKNQTGVLTDPSPLTVKIKDPLGVVETFTYGVDAELIKDSTGNFHIAHDPGLQGVYLAKWEGTIDTNKGVVGDKILVVEDFFD
jgi:hypothetical protein